MTRHKHGWIPDLPDHRDHLYKGARRRYLGMMAPVFPPLVDLRPNCPPVYDQGQLGSCVANGSGGCHHFGQMKQTLADVFMPSRLMIYFGARLREGSVNQDAGAMIRDGIKTLAADGACPETMWPYDISKFDERPPQACYDFGKGHVAVEYQRVDNTDITALKQCLVDGFPIVFGATLYDSFETHEVASTGKVPMPGKDESVVGGHCMVIVGYDDSIQCWIVRNSWGLGWGDGGYCYIPYAYLTDDNLANDFWTIRLVLDQAVQPVPPKPTPIKHSWWWYIIHPFG